MCKYIFTEKRNCNKYVYITITDLDKAFDNKRYGKELKSIELEVEWIIKIFEESNYRRIAE